MIRLCITMMFVLFLLPSLLFAQSAEKGQALCYQIEKTINALVDYTETSCLYGAGKQPNSYSFVIISSKPVFSVEPSKKAWLLVAVAAVGDTLNKNHSVKADEIWFSDAASMKNRLAYVFPAPLAKSLQRQIKKDEISLETMYAEISKNLNKKTIPKK